MIVNPTKNVREFKEEYEIEGDIPTDLTKLFGIFNVSSLPKEFEADPENYVLCEFATDMSGRKTIHYREAFLCMAGFPDRVVSVYALIHHLLSGEENFCITTKTRFSEREKSFVYELLMPEEQIREVLEEIKLPIKINLAKIFRVSPEFARNRLKFLEEMKKKCDGSGADG